MNSYELNKIFGAVVSSVLAITVIGYISNLLVRPHQLEKSVLDIKIESAAPTATAAAPVELPPITPLMASADAAAGAALLRNCTSCHTFEKGGRNGVGPNLWDIVGNKKAHMDGFAYSPGVAAKGGQWEYEDLNHFLANPRAFIPGTRMAFAGMRRVEDRANLIAHLRTLSDSPKPLP